MELREAQSGDSPGIREVARRSLQASYSLDPKAIVGAVEKWYDEDSLQERIDADDKLLLVALEEGQIVGFTDCVVIEGNTAEILWLHVDPDNRGEGYGVELYEESCELLEEKQGVTTLHGRVLADNPDGNSFYESRGMTKVGEEQIEIDGQTHVENVYAELGAERMEELDVGDDVVFLDHQTTEIGSIAPFHVVYTTREGSEIYGYWCSNCENLANAMDASGRIRCDECGNARKPTRWDAAYL